MANARHAASSMCEKLTRPSDFPRRDHCFRLAVTLEVLSIGFSTLEKVTRPVTGKSKLFFFRSGDDNTYVNAERAFKFLVMVTLSFSLFYLCRIPVSMMVGINFYPSHLLCLTLPHLIVFLEV